MAFNIADRVLETSVSTGTGTFAMAGAVTGYRTFASVLNDGDTTWYMIEGTDSYGNPTGEWETGVGTWTASGTILTRTSVLTSSNANAAVSFSVGTKRVAIIQPTQGIAYTQQGVLTNDTVATTETIVAQFALAPGALIANSLFQSLLSGQVSSTATLTFRVRIGTAGTTADALAGTFATSAAGAANAYVTGDIIINCLTAGASGTAYATGCIQLANAVLGPAAAAFSPATVNTTVQNFVSITLVQSAAQTYTSRTGVLTRLQ